MKQYVKERKKIFNYKTKCRLIYATLGLATTLEKFKTSNNFIIKKNKFAFYLKNVILLY